MAVLKIFSKKLTKTDVEKVLSLPIESLSFFPSFEENRNYQDVVVEDEEGCKWPFRLAIRREGYLKPVISADGWLHFVRSKQLQIGFNTEFFKEEDEVTREVKYKVKLMKPYIVFRVVFGYVSHCPAG